MKKVIVYEPFVHFIPTGNGWYEGFKELGYDVEKVSSNDKSIYDLSLREGDIDLFVIFGASPTNVKPLIKLKDRKACKIVHVIFGFQEYFKELKDVVDLWVEHVCRHTLIKDMYDYYEMPFEFVQLGASNELFYPIEDINKEYDVSFVGQFAHGYRGERELLFPLIDKYKGFFSGFEYNGKRFPFVNHTDLNRIYNSTKVNINFHYDHQKEEDDLMIDRYIEFNGRTFEIALSGGFQIIDHPKIKEGFGEGIVYADKSNWLDVVEHYIKNDDERENMAKISLQTAKENHSWKSRMKTVIDRLQ